MNGPGKAALTVAAAVVIASAGTVYAFAGWTSAVGPTSVTVRTVAMPAGNAPSVARIVQRADIKWVANRLRPGVKAQSYVVTRHGAGKAVVVCDRVPVTSCRDQRVPPGVWTWRVQPVFETWTGRPSADSAALTFAGPAPVPATPLPPVPPQATPTPGDGSPVRTSPPPVMPGTSPDIVTDPPDTPPAPDAFTDPADTPPAGNSRSAPPPPLSAPADPVDR